MLRLMVGISLIFSGNALAAIISVPPACLVTCIRDLAVRLLLPACHQVFCLSPSAALVVVPRVLSTVFLKGESLIPWLPLMGLHSP